MSIPLLGLRSLGLHFTLDADVAKAGPSSSAGLRYLHSQVFVCHSVVQRMFRHATRRGRPVRKRADLRPRSPVVAPLERTRHGQILCLRAAANRVGQFDDHILQLIGHLHLYPPLRVRLRARPVSPIDAASKCVNRIITT